VNRRDGLLLAVGTLTALPVPAPERVDSRCARAGMLLAPLAALVPGLAAAAAVTAGTGTGLAAPVSAVLAVLVLTLTTRGLHLDGLADTCDGLAASYRRDRALTVMRRGDSGPAGVAAVVLVLMLQVTSLAQILTAAGTGGGAAAVLTAAVVGRTTLPVACGRGVPAARGDGLGAAVAGSVPRSTATLVVLVVLACSAALSAGTDWSWWAGPAALGAGLLTAGVVLGRAVRRLGGITGDVLGAVVETASTAALVALAALG
jgi:adenosylcobinamide-GDP ribazoletransferase